jgi:hypothetical protein
MRHLRPLSGICAALLALTAPLQAQKKEKEPHRPKLDAALAAMKAGTLKTCPDNCGSAK